MPELTLPSLPKFAAEVSASLSSLGNDQQYCSAVECRIESGPDFKLPPFNLNQSHLGQLIYVVPAVVPMDEACRQINDGKLITTVDNFHIVSDGRSSRLLCIELAGAMGEWRAKLRESAHRHLGENWQMICIESHDGGKASISLLNPFSHKSQPLLPNGGELSNTVTDIGGRAEKNGGSTTVWLAPINRRIVAGSCRSPVPRPIMNGTIDGNSDAAGGKVVVKKRVLRKVAKKLPPTATTDAEFSPIRTPTESTENVVEEEARSEDGNSESMTNSNHKSPQLTGNGRASGSPDTAVDTKLVNKSVMAAEGNQPACVVSSKVSEPITGGNSPLAAKKQRGGLVGKIAAIFNGGRGQTQDGIELPTAVSSTTNGHHVATINAGKEGSGSAGSLARISIPFEHPINNNNNNNDHQPVRNGTIGRYSPPLHSDGALIPSSSSEVSGSGSTPALRNGVAVPEKIAFPSPVEDGSPVNQTPPYKSTSPPPRTSRSTERISPVRRTISMPPTSAPPLTALKTITPAALNRRLLSPTLISARFGQKLSPISSGGSSIADGDDEMNGERTLCLSEQVDGIDRDDDLKSEDLCSFREDFSLASSMVSESLPAGKNFSRSSDLSKRIGGCGEMKVVGHPSTSSSGRPCGRDSSPLVDVAKKGMVRGMADVPVVVLQQVLALLSYAELAELRRVHPHWDELSGQFLNSGYYQLLGSADRLLTDCQRRVHKEKRLAKPMQILTNLQVHVLNKVDVLRAPMDEGVLCFPYGLLLDQGFELLERVEAMIAGEEDGGDSTVPNWEPLAELSRRAQAHYRRYVEREAERRMSEVSRLTVAHRLQRIDSFLSEANNTKLEKIAEKSREELSYEIEVLKGQNKQLRTDNRELKQKTSKLDARVEALERKFKLLGRLLGQ